jgi:hypothetical protein
MDRPVHAIRTALRAARTAVANPGVRRLETAWLLGYLGDAAIMVSITLAMFADGGAFGVAILGAARMLPATAAGLVAAVPLARWRADRILGAMAVARGIAGLAAAGILAAAAPPAWLLPVAGALGVIAAVVRPVHNTALPTLARSPEELIAANVATATAEALGTFSGPAAAAVLIAVGLGDATGVVTAAASAIAVAGLRGIDYESEDERLGPARRSASAPPIRAGLRAIRRRPAVALTLAGFFAQVAARGLLNTFMVVASLRLLGMGEPGVGVLGAALGVGGALGLFAGLAVGGSSTRTFLLALAAWGAPIGLIALVPAPIVAVGALAVTGLANAVLDIAGFTILQRGSANQERGGIFAILETGVGVGTMLGSLAAPVLIAALGDQGAMVAGGAFLPLVALGLAAASRDSGQAEVVPTEDLARLRAIPVFAALPMSALERLAHGARPRTFRAGETLMTKGEPGDTYLVLRSGSAEIVDGDRILDTVGPGSGIGEIALLRDGLRTATVRALTDVEVDELDAAIFRAAIAGPLGTVAAECLVVSRLSRSVAVP